VVGGVKPQHTTELDSQQSQHAALNANSLGEDNALDEAMYEISS